MAEQFADLDVAQIKTLLETVIAGLRVHGQREDYAYSLEEVAQRTGVAVSTLVRDCRADRLEHISKGDFRGMTPLQVAAMLKRYTRGGDLAQPAPVVQDDMAAAREASMRAATRSPRRRTAA